MIMNKAIFIFSLDTELLWGYRADPFNNIVSLMKKDPSHCRQSLDFLLDLLEKYNIPSTWAIVGHLFLDHCENEGDEIYEDMPKDWYAFDPCSSINESSLYYGKDIVEKILSNRIDHEIGYHSFSHKIFSECTKEVAVAEIEKGVYLAKQYGITLNSFVFPQNKIGHTDVLKKFGFRVYRGHTILRASYNQNRIIRYFNSALDKIIASPTEPIWRDGIWEIPGSMFFGDTTFKYSVVTKAKLGLKHAISTNSIFHIYLHPHDLLLYDSLKNDLDDFLRFVGKNRDLDKINIMTMGEAVESFSL